MPQDPIDHETIAKVRLMLEEQEQREIEALDQAIDQDAPDPLPSTMAMSLLGIAFALAKMSDQGILAAVEAIHDSFPGDEYLYHTTHHGSLAYPLHYPLWSEEFQTKYGPTHQAVIDMLNVASRRPLPPILRLWAVPFGYIHAADLLIESTCGIKLAQRVWDRFLPGQDLDVQKMIALAIDYWDSFGEKEGQSVTPDTALCPPAAQAEGDLELNELKEKAAAFEVMKQQNEALQEEISRLRGELESQSIQSGGNLALNEGINSPTLQRILDAVKRFPEWRNEQRQAPNLKAIKGWQESEQRNKGNAARVAHVAHHVVAEHYGLK